jgi:hypothetical protein
VEGVMGYFQLLRIILNFFFATADGLASKQINRHAPDGADVHKRMIRLWRLEIGFRKHLRIKLRGFVQVVPLETSAVYLANLVELLAGLGLKRAEGPNSLRGEYAPIKSDPVSLDTVSTMTTMTAAKEAGHARQAAEVDSSG